MKRGTLVRTAWVLLAAALVITATWTLHHPYDAARELEAQAAAAKGQAPAPGAEALLRRSIAAPPPWRPRPGTDVTRLGPLQSITYLGALNTIPLPGLGRRIDSFQATYRNGTLVWQISPASDGARPLAAYFNPELMTPQQTIELYSTPHAAAWAMTMVEQLGILLIFALVGRFVLRIRL